MAVVIVQGGTTNGAATATGATLDKALGSAASVGNAVVVIVLIEDTTTTLLSVTDNLSNAYTIDGGPTSLISATNRMYWASCVNLANAPQTVTSTISVSGKQREQWVYEVSGLRSSAYWDAATTGNGTGTGITFNFTPSFADSFALGLIDYTAGGPRTAVGAAWTANQELAAFNWEAAQSKVTTTALAQAFDATRTSASGSWFGGVGVYKGLAAAGGGTGWGAPFIAGKRNHLVRVA